MGSTISQRIVDAMPWLDNVSEAVQPRGRGAVEKNGTTVRNVLDGVPMQLPLHPALTDVPLGAWTGALIFDGLDVVTGSKAMRNAADASLVLGVAGGFAAAATGLSDWRYLSGGSRRMGMAHGLLNSVGLLLSSGSLVLRAAGRRRAGQLAFLAGFSISGTAAHLGGELSYNHGLRVNHNTFEPTGPDEFVAVLPDEDLPSNGLRRVEVNGAGVLLSRTEDGRIWAIASTCSHMGGPLEEGVREDHSIICPLHGSRFDLCNGRVLDGPAVFPQSSYQTRVRNGQIELQASAHNIQNKVR
jgi:nitrite reductase/ring-hydroxylating ferredoxin subunit/uncharacterized membrane protein